MLSTMSNVDFSGMVAALAEGVKIIDVRTEEEYREGYIPGTVNLPLNEVYKVYGSSIPQLVM